jgi:hypothetical protein
MSKFSRWIEKILRRIMITILLSIVIISILTVLIGIFTIDWIPSTQ